jgi:predicted Zn-dependent protease with MMP-like domain
MTLPLPDSLAPSLAQIEMLARDAVLALPQPYREAATAIVLRIDDFAPDHLLDLMELTDPFALTGLYDGMPLTEKSVLNQVMGPDVIWLFRRPILDEWASRGNVTLSELITHVLVHELAHHFGWSDDDIASVDPWWE